MSQEIELKLSLPPEALPALRRHPLFSGGAKQGKAATLDNTYFDTPDLSLKADKVAVRTRRQGRRLLQTVKCAAESVGGLTARPEWEQTFAGKFDFSAIDAPKVQKRLLRHEAELVPVFSTRFRRETRLHKSDDVRILMMIDSGEVIAGERREPICELELELVEGSALDLLELARRLAEELPLWPNDASKAERGFRLHLGEPLQPVSASAPRIDGSQRPLEAFRALAFSCVRQWQANAAGAAVDGDPEFVHQLRVALRRLRSLLSLFAPALPAEFVAEWRSRLKENADRFTEVRELDVLHDEILAPVAAVAAEAADYGLDHLLELARTANARARAAAHDGLAPAQGRLLIDLTAALHSLTPPDAGGDTDLSTFAQAQLKRLHGKARKRHAAARDGAPAHLHALRLAVKRLRYAAEFFAPLMRTKDGERYLRDLSKAQSRLGFVHDVDVARRRLASWAKAEPDRAAAAAFVAGWHGHRQRRMARRALRDLEPLLSDPPRLRG
ncbi:CYTH and CHAD domain-containing protein [Aromatoleum sp.]|uniref:CYTH and CHAD domain-containing protein n=1 Tax=Aromatoleum sp. TaxID=2307007 RepID=UPI002FC6D50A